MRVYWKYKRYNKTKWKNSELKSHQKIEIILNELYGAKVAQGFKSMWEYVFYTKNPLGMIFYVSMSIIGYVYCFHFGIGSYCPGPYLASYHHWLSAIIMGIGWALYLLCVSIDPGQVTEKLLKNQKQDVFDEVMYKKDSFCNTCKVMKPARSKHCTVCDICVPHFDHHCIWINKCVTKYNHIYFLAFVGWHALICLYGSITYLLVVLGELKKDTVK